MSLQVILKLEPCPVTVIPIVQMLSLFPSQEARIIPSVDCKVHVSFQSSPGWIMKRMSQCLPRSHSQLQLFQDCKVYMSSQCWIVPMAIVL